MRQRVKFTGQFVHDDTDCFRESALSLKGSLTPARRLEIRMRVNSNLSSGFKLIWVVQSPCEKYFA